MAKWNEQVKVGLAAVIGLALLLVLLFNASNWPWSVSGDVLLVQFGAVNDLHLGAGVQLSGVKVGKVTGIELKADENIIEVQIRVKDGFRRLRQGCRVRIGTIGFVGETYIDIRNGPVGNPPLQPEDLPLVGEDPKSILDLLEIAEQAVTQATQVTQSANTLIESNHIGVSQGIKEVRELVVNTSTALESVVRNTEKSVETLNRLASDNDSRLQRIFNQINRLLEQVQSDSSALSSDAGEITQSVLSLIDRNSETVDEIIRDLHVSSSKFRETSQTLHADLSALKSEMSNLILKSTEVIDAEAPKIDRLLKSLTVVSEDLVGLRENFAQLLDKVQSGEGSVAALINKPDAHNKAQDVLQAADETIGEIKTLFHTFNEKSESFKFPDVAWDYELRYVNLEKHLHNELAVLLLPAHNKRYRLGFGIRNEDVKFELQFGYDFNDHLRGRLGFMRSTPGLGFDFWLLSKKLGATIEATRLTSGRPELDTELSWKVFPHGHVIIGAENLTDDIRYTAGFRLAAKNW